MMVVKTERWSSGRAARVAGLVWFALQPASAQAAEYCVTCTDPAAMYACVVGGTAADAPPDAREQMLCITEIAKSGGHGKCSVPRSAPKPCPGVLKIIAAPAGGAPAGASGAAGETAPPKAAPEAQTTPQSDGAATDGAMTAETPAEPPAKPPRTVEELAKRTVQSSKDGISKAGESVGEAGSAVGEAAKKTWDCVVSLFSDC